jgi:hypothetical protein
MEKQAEKIIANEKKSFNDEVQSKVKTGMPFETAVFTTIEESNNKYANNMLDEAEKILIIAKKINKEGNKELGKKLAQLSFKVVKEAQARGFWGGLKGLVNKIPGVAGWGGGAERNMLARIRSLATDLTQVYNTFENNQVDARYMNRPIQQLKQRLTEDLGVTSDLASKYPDNYMLQQLHRHVRDIYSQLTKQVEPLIPQGNIQGVTQLLGRMSNYIQNTVMKDFSTSNQMYQKQRAGIPGTPEQAAPNAAQVAPQTSPAIDSKTVMDFINNLDINDPTSAQMLTQISSIVQSKMTKATPAATVSPTVPAKQPRGPGGRFGPKSPGEKNVGEGI